MIHDDLKQYLESLTDHELTERRDIAIICGDLEVIEFINVIMEKRKHQ